MLGVVKSFDTEVTSYLEKLPLSKDEGEAEYDGKFHNSSMDNFNTVRQEIEENGFSVITSVSSTSLREQLIKQLQGIKSQDFSFSNYYIPFEVYIMFDPDRVTIIQGDYRTVKKCPADKKNPVDKRCKFRIWNKGENTGILLIENIDTEG